ncbi:MAG: histidine phosphatase family protein [Candidatus Latescibacteria bacterium]|nr:histidine phosphatase family protein [Candidatus Latescibacterota bacterium]
MDLHITRHGQVLPPGSDTWTRADYPGDPPLSNLGYEQARCLGERLRDLGFTGAIYASPYRRTLQTACELAEVLDLVVQPVAALREIVMRDDQMQGFVGMNAAQLQALHPRVRGTAAFGEEPWWTTAAETDADFRIQQPPAYSLSGALAGGDLALHRGGGDRGQQGLVLPQWIDVAFFQHADLVRIEV